MGGWGGQKALLFQLACCSWLFCSSRAHTVTPVAAPPPICYNTQSRQQLRVSHQRRGMQNWSLFIRSFFWALWGSPAGSEILTIPIPIQLVAFYMLIESKQNHGWFQERGEKQRASFIYVLFRQALFDLHSICQGSGKKKRTRLVRAFKKHSH